MKCFCFIFRVVPEVAPGVRTEVHYANATVWVLGEVKEQARHRAREYLAQHHWKFGQEESVVATTVRQHPGSHRSGKPGVSVAMHKHLQGMLRDLLRDGVAADFYQVQRPAASP